MRFLETESVNTKLGLCVLTFELDKTGGLNPCPTFSLFTLFRCCWRVDTFLTMLISICADDKASVGEFLKCGFDVAVGNKAGNVTDVDVDNVGFVLGKVCCNISSDVGDVTPPEKVGQDLGKFCCNISSDADTPAGEIIRGSRGKRAGRDGGFRDGTAGLMANIWG